MKIPRISRVVVASVLALLLLVPLTAQEQFEQPVQSVQPECVIACTEDYNPVCSTSNKLYTNLCNLQRDACEYPGEVDLEPLRLPNGDLDLSCDSQSAEEPIGGTADINEPWPWPPGTDSGESSSSSSSSSSGDSDSADDSSDDSGYQLPPNVVIDDSTPPAANFVPVTPAPTTSAPVTIDDEDFLGGTADIELEESAVWEGEGDSSASSSSGDDDSNDDNGGDDGGDNNGDGGNGTGGDGGVGNDTDGDGGGGNGTDGDGGGGNGTGGDGGVGNGHPLCEMTCSDVFDPVCASNSATYDNRCRLAVAQCEHPTLEPMYSGECGSGAPPAVDPCGFDCPMFDSPVCSAEGHIYSNQCTYSSALCRDATLSEATAELCIHDDQ